MPLETAETALLEKVQNARDSGADVDAVLKTDERVFARITDGIYREPASALRELVANAYDADATDVRITTDAPRFSKIVVRDNGHGLSEEALVHVMCHIGGSLKRTRKGVDLDVANAADPNLSPKKRRLIGKLGIGLFSVSQLTHHVVIVTKVKGERYRRVCEVVLVPQGDDRRTKSEDTSTYVTGRAKIRTLPATDVDSHGTEITLLNIRSFVRESLQSQATWAAIDPRAEVDEQEPEPTELEVSDEGDEFGTQREVPAFHMGRVSLRDSELLLVPPSLPWNPEDDPSTKFLKLVNGVRSLDPVSRTAEKVSLLDVLDNYLHTIWVLSLSVPLGYAQGGPFDITGASGIKTFSLSNKAKRSVAEEVQLDEDETLAEHFKLDGDVKFGDLPFSVYFDGIRLARPILFGATAPDAVSAMFVGKMRSELTNVDEEFRGGPIEFEAYIYWQPRIVPLEHSGVLVRINGASGIPFDEHFLQYRVADSNRLRQLSAEIYIKEGLDAALNIDRESFNIAHAHYQLLKKWLHNALRQVTNKQKASSTAASSQRLAVRLSDASEALSEIVKRDRPSQTPARTVEFHKSPGAAPLTSNALSFEYNKIFGQAQRKPTTHTSKARSDLLEKQIAAVAAVLDGFDVFSHLDPEQRESLLKKIVAIFTVDLKA